MIHQAGSEPSRDQLFHLWTTARDIPYRIVNGVAEPPTSEPRPPRTRRAALRGATIRCCVAGCDLVRQTRPPVGGIFGF
jgi:hypothetical protein